MSVHFNRKIAEGNFQNPRHLRHPRSKKNSRHLRHPRSKKNLRHPRSNKNPRSKPVSPAHQKNQRSN